MILFGMRKKIERQCSWCGISIMRHPINPNTGKFISTPFCGNECKGLWQLHFDKPEGVSKEWLVQKYEVDGYDCAEIGRMVGRDTKSVWNWMKGFGIKTRGRGSSTGKQYLSGVRKQTPPPIMTDAIKDKIRQSCISNGRVPYKMPDGSHYMKGRRGDKHHGWQGGLTPDREKLAKTDEWREVVKAIWARSDAKCERCGKDHRAVDNRQKEGFHIHHIRPFRFVETRSELSNLILLCRPCHHFVHSKKNTEKELIRD